MIPIRLQLKNFLSYGSELQTIDFSPYNLICFSGKNGHGKSALLDAITWAIWGYARKTIGAAKADQGLLRLGQTNMMVCLDFSCNNSHYRIRRELTIRHNKPVAALDYGIVQADGTIASLTDKTIRATQQKIEHDIHLDFESFCNSAFLRQGQSNEFCKKSPKDRKEILTRILGLQQYEAIRRRAMDKAKQAHLEKQQLSLLLETLSNEIATEDTLNAEQKKLTESIEAIQKELDTQHKAYQVKKHEIDQLIEQKNRHAVDLFALDQTCKQKDLLKNQLQTARSEWRNIHKQQIKAQDITHLQKELEQLTQQCAHFQEKLQKGLKLKEQFLSKKNERATFEAQWRKTFYADLEQRKSKYHTLLLEIQKTESLQSHADTQHTALTKQLAEIIKEEQALKISLNTTEKIKQSFNADKKQFDRRKEAYQRYIAEGNIYTTQLAEHKQKQILACKTESASCPLCEQTVTASRRRFLEAKFARQVHTLTRKVQRLSRVVQALKPIIITQHAQLEPLQKKIHEEESITRRLQEIKAKQDILQKEIASLTNTIQETKKQREVLQAKRKEMHTALEKHEQSEQMQLKNTEQYAVLSQYIQTCEQEAKKLGYNAAIHKEVEQKKNALLERIEKQKTIVAQQPLQEERKKQIINVCKQIKALNIQQKNLEDKTKEVKTIDTKRMSQQKSLEETQQKIERIQKEKETLLQHTGSLNTQRTKLAITKEKYKKIKEDITQKTLLQQEYTAIAHAMSKDGIQALLIEDVIPEIEYETNELLTRLTNNQTQIIIESLKDLKSGATRETLDIFISDALGIRPYELFSGGEAFRIDFALRIAISKLVARRAGTALQTLIIDEGFGSQDEEGLSLMMDALYKIQDDFEKIIIVSHLPFMKDHFPVHFTIEKGPTGSNVSVIEHG